MNWSYYYRGLVELNKPEQCLKELKLPDYIDSVYIFGCSTGEDFLPFENKYKLYGFDLVPESDILWCKKLNNFSYTQLSIDEFNIQPDIDLQNVFVFTCGVVGCVSELQQELFFQKLQRCNCKNIIFQEYPKGTHLLDFKLNHELFNIDQKNKQFVYYWIK